MQVFYLPNLVLVDSCHLGLTIIIPDLYCQVEFIWSMLIHYSTLYFIVVDKATGFSMAFLIHSSFWSTLLAPPLPGPLLSLLPSPNPNTPPSTFISHVFSYFPHFHPLSHFPLSHKPLSSSWILLHFLQFQIHPINPLKLRNHTCERAQRKHQINLLNLMLSSSIHFITNFITLLFFRTE